MISKHDKPLSCETSECRTDRPAVGRTDSDDLRDVSNGVPVGRRGFVKGLGAMSVGAIALGSSRGPVGDVQAIPPLVIGGAALAGSVALGWALREYEIIGADSPPEGLTGDALRNQVDQAIRVRWSENASTITDNQNILEGMDNVAYVEGKIAAIDALNDQLSQEDVESEALEATYEYETIVKENLLKSWNETANEFVNLVEALDSHSDAFPSQVIGTTLNPTDSDEHLDVTGIYDTSFTEYELPNGDTFDVVDIEFEGEWDFTGEYPLELSDWPDDRGEDEYLFNQITEDRYWEPYLFASILDDISYAMGDVRDGLILWVDNVYSSVQSGEINVDELITPRERAAMMAEEEGMAQAIADLAALNIPVDLEREATIYLPHVDATLRGVLASTDEVNIESGETYDPSDMDGSCYLTYDASLGEGTWSGYDDPVDGGEVTFTAEPWESTTFRVHTIADESVELVADDFTAVDANGDPVDDWDDPDAWVVDISSDVETAITEIAEVEYFATDDSAQMETIRLSDSFTVERIEDTSTGEEETSLQFSSSEPQADDNYITQEEWDTLESQNQELIEKYEDSQGGGSGLDLSAFDMFGVPGELVALVLAGAAAYLGIVNK